MKVILKDDVIVLVPETANDASELRNWASTHHDHVLAVRSQQDNESSAIELRPLGPRAEACREPINIVSDSPDEAARLISNLAPTPFHLDGRNYASVEAFWQGLKYPDEADRERTAALDGPHAKSEGSKQGYATTLVYQGQEIRTGTNDHWRLMERACRAKFDQNAAARESLLSTGERPLVHLVRRDSKTIPGVIMAEIWMRIRRDLRRT